MTTIGIGTEKGGFLLRDGSEGWTIDGPRFPGWKVTTWSTTPAGSHLAALGSNWFGAAIQRSDDLDSWEQVPKGPAFPEDGPTLNQIWAIRPHRNALLAGVDEAGLFRSHDDGMTWEPVSALNEHESRHGWSPGLGGLCTHHILTDENRIWVGISAVGVFRSDDDGASFERLDAGVTPTVDDPQNGYCVHGLAADPDDADRIWRQDHSGVYRTLDGADSWERIEGGLPACFGFPIACDPRTGRVFCVPLESDMNRLPVDGRLRAYRSDDGGESWDVSGAGWDEGSTYTAVLRGAMDTDGKGGVYFGTTGGDVWATRDSGDTWERLPHGLPRILSVRVLG